MINEKFGMNLLTILSYFSILIFKQSFTSVLRKNTIKLEFELNKI